MSVGWRLRLGKGFRQSCALKLSQMSLGLKRKKSHSEKGVLQKAINSQIAVSLGEVSPFLPACTGWCLCVSMFVFFFLFSVSLQIWLSLLPCACVSVLSPSRWHLRTSGLSVTSGGFFRRCCTNQTHPVLWFCALFTIFHPNYSFFLCISLLSAWLLLIKGNVRVGAEALFQLLFL